MTNIVFPALDQTLTARMQGQLEVAQSYVIDSDDMYDAAAADLQSIKTLQKTIENQRKEQVKPINDGVNKINDFYREPAALLVKAETVLKSAMKAWTEAQARIAAAERQRLDDIAAAARRAEEVARKDAPADAAAPLTDTPAPTSAQAPAPLTKARSVSGISNRKVWKAEVTDKHAFIKHVAANPGLIDLLDINSKILNDFVQLRKAALNFDGIRVFEDLVIAARAK